MPRVAGPDGTAWRVERRLWTWPRWRGKPPSFDLLDGAALDVPDLGGGLGGVVAAILLVVLLVIVLPLVIALFLPIVLFAVELPLAVAFVGWRAARGRWRVVARTEAARLEWRAYGHADSRRLLCEVVGAIRSGTRLPPPTRQS